MRSVAYLDRRCPESRLETGHRSKQEEYHDPEQTDALPDAGWFSPDNPVVCSAP